MTRKKLHVLDYSLLKETPIMYVPSLYGGLESSALFFKSRLRKLLLRICQGARVNQHHDENLFFSVISLTSNLCWKSNQVTKTTARHRNHGVYESMIYHGSGDVLADTTYPLSRLGVSLGLPRYCQLRHSPSLHSFCYILRTYVVHFVKNGSSKENRYIDYAPPINPYNRSTG